MFSLRSLFTRSTGNSFYLSLCCIVKNESEYLEEWMNYHLLTGVEHFYIYDNGSATPVAEILQQFGLAQWATVIPMPGVRKQVKAYRHCIKTFRDASRWIGFIDIDEFIVAKATGGNLPSFLNDFEPYGGLAVNWLIFGSGGHITKPALPQLESFLLRSGEDFSPNQHIKTIVQPKRVNKLATVHSFTYKKPYFCVNEDFVPVEYAFSKTSVQKIQLNHYYCRSLEEYNNKIKRGFADKTEQRSINEFYMHDKHCNNVQDTVILDMKKLLTAQKERSNTLPGPG